MEELRLREVRKSTLLLGIKLSILLTFAAWAANSVVQMTSYTGEIGALDTINNQFLTTSKGFSTTSVAAAVGTSCGSPVTFGSGTAANTALTAGHVIFEVQVNTTASTPISTCFTVTLYLSSNTASESQYGPIYLATGGTVSPGETIDCKFDLGTTSLPSPPFAYRLTIA